MKHSLIIAALIAAPSAFANDIDPFGFDKQAFVSTTTRAEVLAELQVAINRGQIPYGEVGNSDTVLPGAAPKTRAEVKAELAEARARGELNYGEIAAPIAAVEDAPSHARVSLAK